MTEERRERQRRGETVSERERIRGRGAREERENRRRQARVRIIAESVGNEHKLQQKKKTEMEQRGGRNRARHYKECLAEGS